MYDWVKNPNVVLTSRLVFPCFHCRQANREKRELLPTLAFTGFGARYVTPKLSEGFDEIFDVPFKVSLVLPFFLFLSLLLSDSIGG